MQNQVYFFVYKITCRENDKCYIGVSKNTETRFKKHRYDARRSLPCHIHRAMRKYGVHRFDFEVIYGSKDEKYIREEMESYFINLYDSRRNGYNCTDGGEGGSNPTEETRQKLRAASLGNKNSVGRVVSLETREKMRAAKLGTANATGKRSVEARIKMSISHIGKKQLEETKIKRRAAYRACNVCGRFLGVNGCKYHGKISL